MRSQRGSSLLEAIIAIGILGIAVGAATSYFASSGNSLRIENVKEVQTSVAGRLQAALANPDAITNTLTYGATSANLIMLKNCIEGKGSGCTTVATNPANNLTIDLYDAYMAQGAPRPQRLSGPGVGWDKDGNWCMPGDTVRYPGCLFTTETKFWATCDLNPGNSRPKSSCTQARYINFKFKVAPINQHMFQGKGAIITQFPKPADYDSAEPMSAVRMRAADVLSRLGADCGGAQTNKKMVGIDSVGKPICRCIDGSTGDAQGKCQRQACKTGEIMVGFVQGPGGILKPDCINQASCVNDTQGKCPCMTVNLDQNGDCGAGFWMVSIDYGECTATTEKDKGGPETIKCSRRTGRCCKLDVQ